IYEHLVGGPIADRNLTPVLTHGKTLRLLKSRQLHKAGGLSASGRKFVNAPVGKETAQHPLPIIQSNQSRNIHLSFHRPSDRVHAVKFSAPDKDKNLSSTYGDGALIDPGIVSIFDR